jgi:hypothetical protein
MDRMSLEVLSVIVAKSVFCGCDAICDVSGVLVACLCQIPGEVLVDFESYVEIDAMEDVLLMHTSGACRLGTTRE